MNNTETTTAKDVRTFHFSLSQCRCVSRAPVRGSLAPTGTKDPRIERLMTNKVISTKFLPKVFGYSSLDRSINCRRILISTL